MNSSTKIPRYIELARRMRRDIQEGHLQAGEQLPPFLAMKASHGLSQSTWERMLGVLENDGLIVREERKGTFVADLSSRRKQKERFALGVLGLGFSSQEIYWMHILSGIREAAHDAGCDITLLHPTGSGEGWEKIDGVLLNEEKPGAFLKSKPLSLPCVHLLTSEATREAGFDEAAGVQMAVRHLVELGHRRIGYLLTNRSELSVREIAYQSALHAAKIRFEWAWLRRIANPSPLREKYFYRGAQDAMRDWLQNGWKETGCTALLCQNDEMALGVLAALREAKISVPEDVSIVGFDGTEISEYSHPRLTTIEAPLRESGRVATQMLLERMGENNSQSKGKGRAKKRQHIVLPVRLKLGESSAPPKTT